MPVGGRRNGFESKFHVTGAVPRLLVSGGDRTVGFIYTADMSDHSDSAHNGSPSTEARRTFYEGHRTLALFMILVVFAAPFAGLYVAGLLGTVVGVVASAAAYVLIPYLWNWLGD
jgi:hypothetical protein